MGYILLGTLGELLFTQFLIFVLLCTCLLVSRVCLFFFNYFCFGKTAKRLFLLFSSFCLKRKQRFYFSISILIFFPLP